jgi:hypothetical protein
MSQCTGIPRLTEILTRDFKEVSKLTQERTWNVHRIRGEGGGWILLGDNTGGGAIKLPPIRFLCVGIWILAGLPCVYAHGWVYIHTVHSRRIFRNANTAEIIEYLYCQMIELLFEWKLCENKGSCLDLKHPVKTMYVCLRFQVEIWIRCFLNTKQDWLLLRRDVWSKGKVWKIGGPNHVASMCFKAGLCIQNCLAETRKMRTNYE